LQLLFESAGGHLVSDIKSIDLRGKVRDAGQVSFIRAEWKNPESRFMIIRYSMDGAEARYGLRLDLDKAAFLDDVDDPATNNEVQARAGEIWRFVVARRLTGKGRGRQK
jgi:hypothetical protein